MTLDTSHIGQSRFDIVDFFKENKERVKIIHLSDFDGLNQHLPLGEGKLPLKQFLYIIKKSSFDGLIVFEIHNFLDAKLRKEKISVLTNSFRFVKTILK